MSAGILALKRFSWRILLVQKQEFMACIGLVTPDALKGLCALAHLCMLHLSPLCNSLVECVRPMLSSPLTPLLTTLCQYFVLSQRPSFIGSWQYLFDRYFNLMSKFWICFPFRFFSFFFFTWVMLIMVLWLKGSNSAVETVLLLAQTGFHEVWIHHGYH